MNIVKNILVYENEVLLDKNYIIENIGSDVLMEISPPKKETIKNNRNLSSLKKSSSQQKITVEKKGINSEEKKYKNMKKIRAKYLLKIPNLVYIIILVIFYIRNYSKNYHIN